MAFDAWKVEKVEGVGSQQMDLLRIPGPEMNEMDAKRKGFPSFGLRAGAEMDAMTP